MDLRARLTLLTRLGFAARGLLYIVIALLLLRRGQAEDPSGALTHLADGGGRVLLMVMIAGFIAYGLWRLSDAAFNIEGHERGGKGLRQRLGAAGSGIVHLFLAYQAFKLVSDGRPADGGGGADGARTAMELPGGELLLIVGGLVLMGIAGFQLVKAAKASFLEHLEPQVCSAPWAKWTGRFGYGARGLVFLISGFFMVRAGLNEQPGEAGGMERALAWLSSPWDTLVALGLLGFGLFSLIEARFRIIHDIPVDRALNPLP